MELRAIDLRIGNFLNYTTAEGDVLPTTIDWQDLKWISEDPEGFNLVHSPIELDEEWQNNTDFAILVSGNISIWTDKDKCFVEYDSEAEEVKGIDSVHKRQNLYFSLTGEEIEIKQINEINVIDPETVTPE